MKKKKKKKNWKMGEQSSSAKSVWLSREQSESQRTAAINFKTVACLWNVASPREWVVDSRFLRFIEQVSCFHLLRSTPDAVSAFTDRHERVLHYIMLCVISALCAINISCIDESLLNIPSFLIILRWVS